MKFKIILALFLSILICGCSETQLSLKDSRLFMGTVVNITVNAASDAEAKKVLLGARKEILNSFK